MERLRNDLERALRYDADGGWKGRGKTLTASLETRFCSIKAVQLRLTGLSRLAQEYGGVARLIYAVL